MKTPENLTFNKDPKFEKVDHEKFLALKSQLTENKLTCFNVASGSMEPLIGTNTNVMVRTTTLELSQFDIIVFWCKSRQILICHYIWHINRYFKKEDQKILVTRNLHSGEDLPIPEGHVLGKVVSHKIPLATRLKLIFRNWLNQNLRRGFF
ncbi:MAG: S24/S26 family peptidase [Oligoflexia bacterium]|nr:S24/S26 family peptidase [Oligoflexia bacterium]